MNSTEGSLEPRGAAASRAVVFRTLDTHTKVSAAHADRERFFVLGLEMLCIAGFDGLFKQINPAWAAILGHDKAAMLAQPLVDFVHPDDRAATIDEMMKLAQGGGDIVAFENRYRCKDGSYRWLLWSARAVVERRLIYAAAHDVTERRRTEERLRGSNAALEESERSLREALDTVKHSHEDLIQTQLQVIQMEKMNTVGRLAAGVAHDVKNPLAILQMGVDHLATRYSDAGSDSAAVLAVMRHAVRRADIIVRGLVDFSGSRKLELRPHDLNAVIGQALRLLEHELRANRIDVTLELACGLPVVALDETKVEQVLVNVMTNAMHAMSGGGRTGGTMTCRTRTAVHQGTWNGGAPVADDGEWVYLDVEDTGPGVPAADLDMLFEPFFTTKPLGKGTGLGLAVSRRIVELHHGTIEVNNREEGGVRVTISLKTECGGTT